MILETHIPRYPLNQFVDHFIYYEGYNPAHTIDRFLPDGNTEIIFDFHDGPQYIYDNETLKEIQACHHVWASGVRTWLHLDPLGQAGGHVCDLVQERHGLSFFPLCPMNEMSDRVVDADLLWGRNFAHLREHMLEINEVALKFVAA
jgi:hypothetical protein